MATAAATDSKPDQVVMSGYLTKQGGSYKNWKKRHFVLKGTTLFYYKAKADANPKGEIDLKTGRGVRNKNHCSANLEWPQDAKPAVSFGLATKSRTYYMYGSDKVEVRKWMVELQNIIKEHGKPSHDWKQDSEGKPEGTTSKIVRSASKMTTKVTKMITKESGLIDDSTAEIIEGVADAVENQADAGHDASIADRVKMAVGDSAGVVGSSVDNDYVAAAADVVVEQAEADDDVTIGQRVGMAAGTTLQAASESVDNDIGAGVLNTAGGVVHDQAEADADMSVLQRVAIAVGSTAAGVGEAMEDNEVAAAVMKAVEKGAEMAGEMMEEEDNNENDEEKDDEKDVDNTGEQNED